MSQPPFPNEYSLRLVAESDAKSCSTCYKPTTSVLLSSNRADFFYVCAQHLQDVNYATPVHPENYTALINEKAKLTGDLAQWKHDIDAVKPYAWTQLVSKLPFASSSTNESQKKPDDTKDTSETPNASNDKFKQLQENIKSGTDRLNQINDQLSNFKFKTYILNKDIYKIRINNLIQAKVRAKRQQQLHSGGFFPSAPSNPLS